MDICQQIEDLEDRIDSLSLDFEKGIAEKLKETLSQYGETSKKLLYSIGATSYVKAVDEAVRILLQNVEYLDDPDSFDYFQAAWRYLASVIGELCGKTPYYGRGDPTELLPLEVFKQLRQLTVGYSR